MKPCIRNTALSVVVLLSLAGLAGCMHQPVQSATAPAPAPASSLQASQPIPLFSAGLPGQLPPGWQPFKLMSNKKPTEYSLVEEADAPGGPVLHAHAVASASALRHQVDIDPNDRSWLEWRWKAGGLIKTADLFHRETSDSPTRIVLAFDGDRSTLPALDQILFDMAKLITGHEIPYATLMYVWENKAPVASVIPNARTGRIQKIVVESGPEGVGQWRQYSRNIVDDYQKAFKEKPGRLIGIGVLTDTDNTGETVEAWYGDIRLLNRL